MLSLASSPQSAVLIDDQGARAQEIEEQLLAEVWDWGEGVCVEYQVSEVRPYLQEPSRGHRNLGAERTVRSNTVERQ